MRANPRIGRIGWDRWTGVAFVASLFLTACSTAAPTPTSLSTASADVNPLHGPNGSPPATTATPVPVPDLSGMSTQSFRSISPDRQWRTEARLATFEGDPRYEYARVTVSRTDGSASWIPYEVLSEYGGLGSGHISDFYWSEDGLYLYFRHTAASELCGYGFTTNLHRVELQGGRLSEIPLTGMGFGEVTMSPDARRIAYPTADGILLVNLGDGGSHTLPHSWPEGYGYLVGWNAWSPDSEELAFSITQPLCDSPEPPRSSVHVIDLETGETRAPGPSDSWVYLAAQVSADPVPTAALALHEFLSSLYWGARGGLAEYTYERAAALYAGSYETLIGMNPNLDPSGHAALLRRACEVNGYRCLLLRDVISSSAWWGQGGAVVVYFTVYLADPRGGIFALGPCCGEEDGLPQTWFSFSVQESEDGSFQVLELPPYVP